MTSAFSPAEMIRDPFGALSAAFQFREALYPTLAPDMAAAFAQTQRLQLEFYGSVLKLWLLPLNAVHDGPDVGADDAGDQTMGQPALAPLLSVVVDDASDDLQRINGIGPKLQQRLHALGIRRFQQIAALSPDEVAQLNDRIGFKGRIEREGWLAQASRLSKSAGSRQAA